MAFNPVHYKPAANLDAEMQRNEPVERAKTVTNIDWPDDVKLS